VNLIENIKKELRLLSEQPTTYTFHRYQGLIPFQSALCAPSGIVTLIMGVPDPSCSASGISYPPRCPSNAINSANSEATYQGFGAPNVGDIVQIDGNGTHLPGYQNYPWVTKGCYIYKGTTSYTAGQLTQTYSIENVPPAYSSGGIYPDCQTCYGATSPSFDCDPNTLTCSDPGTGNGQYPTMADCTTNCSCDTTTASPCAVQWWQNPNATWASTWINNRDCSNYTWPALNLEQQALDIMNDTNNYGANQPNPQTGPFNGWSDIWGAANTSGLVNPHKGQFIGKMAKSKFSQCQKVDCNC